MKERVTITIVTLRNVATAVVDYGGGAVVEVIVVMADAARCYLARQ